jgi:hypothetical protein
MVEYLLFKFEALISNPVPPKKTKTKAKTPPFCGTSEFSGGQKLSTFQLETV